MNEKRRRDSGKAAMPKNLKAYIYFSGDTFRGKNRLKKPKRTENLKQG
jgi:hypothetical protein